jgi:putative heme-binding domain-containing protein
MFSSLLPIRLAGPLLLLLVPFAALAAEGKIYFQKPEIAPAAGAEIPAPEASSEVPSAVKLLAKGPTPNWIWGADANKKYVLRTTFAGSSKAAALQVTCDNVFTLYLNGKKVAASSEWQAPVQRDVQQFILDGENVLEAEVSNEGNLMGFVLKLALADADGKPRYVVTDGNWQVAAARDAKADGSAKVVAKYGAGPWGDAFAGALAGNGALRDTFNLLPGFQVERLYTVPKEELGSWVSITADDKGRIIASDQGNQGLCRITPPPIGSQELTKVERLKVDISSAQGMLFAFGSLYVSVNGGKNGSGLYRLRDLDGDDQFDEVVKLFALRGGGEHGPHALRLSPDGKSIYLVCGNHTRPPFDVQTNAPPQTMGGPRAEQLHATLPEQMSTRIAPNWDEDQLLPRQWDANGHAAGILAPGGWVAKTDPDGKHWEVVSSGYRNSYDFDFNAEGEMFVYDADMEWDFGAPWYRPTRVVHAVSGSEFGWRSGTGKWPTYYLDSLPPLVNIGPGSPVGVEFGYGTKFPAKYQKALFICDWTFGTMYAIHTTPAGASYQGEKEEFVSRTPLPLTDATVGKDGALYFTIGGRGAQSELFRITYVGKESTAPVELTDSADADLRKLRRQIEAYHVADVKNPQQAAAFLLPHLAHADRHLRYAARVALERLPVALWQDGVLGSSDIETVITGSAGLARQADHDLQPRILAALDKLDYGKLSSDQQLELLRTYQLVFIRLGAIDPATQARLGDKFASLFPGASDGHNRELVILMVYLQSPQAAQKIVPLLARERAGSQVSFGDVLSRNPGYVRTVAAVLGNQPDAQQMYYAYALRNLKAGWTPALLKTYFQWFTKANKWSGGNSYRKFLANIDSDAYANMTDIQRLAVEAAGARQPYVAPELPKPIGPGKDWTLADLLKLGETKLKGRNFKNGERAFAATRCIVCHRFAGDGGATGPDLTQLAGRFNLKDLSEAIVDPSKVISDQYKATVVLTADGQVHTGRIVSEMPDSITLVVDPENATKTITIAKTEIEEQKPSNVSLMPKDLLKPLNEQEVLDLLAYLLSRGNPRDPLFQK